MAITDKARDYWDRISPRERRLVVIAAVAVPIVLALWLGLEIKDGLKTIEAKNARMRQALVVLADLKARGGVAAQPKDDVLAQIPKEPLSLDTYLSNAAEKAGFTLKGTSPRNPVTRDGYITESVNISVDDLDVEKLKVFLAEIEKEKIVVVTHLTINRDRSDKSKLDARLDVSTFAHEPVKDAGSGSAGSGQGG
jgi:general secretion pathway protein M